MNIDGSVDGPDGGGPQSEDAPSTSRPEREIVPGSAELIPLFEQPERSELTQGRYLGEDVPHQLDLGNDVDLARIRDQVHAIAAARLRREFEGRPMIDQATGWLMAVHGCAAAEALGSLTRVAKQHNMTTDDLAAGLAGLAAARGGRSTLDLSPAMKAAVRGVLARPG